MAQVRVDAERFLGAEPEHVYTYLSDYQQHRPRYLPPAFSEPRVEAGGAGAGSVVSYAITAGGRTRAYRVEVSEPQPGRVLVERDTRSSLVTTYTVQPEGEGSQVRIQTTWEGASGIGGFFERLFAPRALRRLYADLLSRLDQYARQRSTGR